MKDELLLIVKLKESKLNMSRQVKFSVPKAVASSLLFSIFFYGIGPFKVPISRRRYLNFLPVQMFYIFTNRIFLRPDTHRAEQRLRTGSFRTVTDDDQSMIKRLMPLTQAALIEAREFFLPQ